MLREKIEHRKGRRLYGYYILWDDLWLYVALRRHKEIYRDGEPSISEAVRSGKAGWAVDNTTLIEARSRGCAVLCVFVKDTGQLYYTHLSNFLPTSGCSKQIDWTGRGGSSQRVVPLDRFWTKSAPIVL